MSKVGKVRNVKKVVEKIDHSSKLRTYVQAQMAVGKLKPELLSLQYSKVHFTIISWSTTWPSTWSKRS